MNPARLLLFLAGALAFPVLAAAQTAADFVAQALQEAKTQNFEAAIGDLDRALALNPGDPMTYYNLGFVKQTKGDYDGAIAALDRAIALEPKDATFYFSRGTIRQAKGDLDAGIADFDQAIALDPNYAQAFMNRGTTKYARNDLDGAIADLDRAVALAPGYAIALNNRGNVRQAKGDLNEAVADFDRAIALDPNYLKAFNNRAGAEYARGHYESAITDYGRVLVLDPNNSGAYGGRGNVREVRGDFKGARADFEKYLELNPKGFDNVRTRLVLLLRRLHADERRAGLPRAVAGWPGGWPRTVGLFMTGATKESDFLIQAAGSDVRDRRERQCEAYYYAGMFHLLRNESEPARRLLEQCVATGLASSQEFKLARAELERMK